MDYTREIKQRLLISDVIKEKISLQRKGDNLIGKCPFHKENTGSFTVNDAKQFYHCFGCGEHGDVFEFLMKIEGLTFTQALSNLANKAGVKINTTTHNHHYKQYDILLIAARWFYSNLTKNYTAKEYLSSRNINNNSIKTFQLGFSPPSGAKDYLLSQNITTDQMLVAGLINKKYNEYFYNRIIFPIHSLNGKIIAFGGRILNNLQPKYINSPESELFKKSETLYGIHLARLEKTDSIIVVEGYLDVITLHQNDIKNVVAPLGTSITSAHLTQLTSLYKDVIICFDGDVAGRNSILKIIKLALNTDYQHQIYFTLLPTNKDPHDIINQNGRDFFINLLAAKQLISSTLWTVLTENLDLTHPEDKIKLKQTIFSYLNTIQDKSALQYYKTFFSKKLNSQHTRRSNPNNLLSSINTTNGETLIKIVILYPELLNNSAAEEQFANFQMETNTLSKLQTLIINHINTQQLDKLSELIKNTDTYNEFRNTLNNQHTITKQQAITLWQRLMVVEEIKILEQEYKHELTLSLSNNHSNEQANLILNKILNLKSNLNS